MSEIKTQAAEILNDPLAKQERIIRDKMNLLKKKILGLKIATGRNAAIRESIRHAYQTFSFYTDWPYATIAIMRHMIERKGPGGFRVDYSSWKDIISYDWHDKHKLADWKTLEELKRGRRFILVKPKAPANPPDTRKGQVKSRLQQKLAKIKDTKKNEKKEVDKNTSRDDGSDSDSDDSEDDIEELDLHGNSLDPAKQVPDLPLTERQIKMIEALSEQSHLGKTFVLITVPTFTDDDDIIPSGIIVDLIIMQATPRDSFGRIPAKLHHFYRCAVCSSTGGIGTIQCKKLIPCPDCGAIYYCSPEHLDAHRYVHTSVFPIGNCGTYDIVKARLAEEFEEKYKKEDMAKLFREKYPDFKIGPKTKEIRDYLEKTMDEIDKEYINTRPTSTATVATNGGIISTSKLSTKGNEIKEEDKSKVISGQSDKIIPTTDTRKNLDFVVDPIPFDFGSLSSDIDTIFDDAEDDNEPEPDPENDIDAILKYASAVNSTTGPSQIIKDKSNSKTPPIQAIGDNGDTVADVVMSAKKSATKRKKQQHPGKRGKRGPYKKKGI